MVEYIQSRDHDIHVCLRRELAEKASGSIEAIELNDGHDGQSNNLDGFCGCQYTDLHPYNKKRHHRQRGSQGHGSNHTRGHLRCERTPVYPVNYQYKQFESDVVQSDPSTDSLHLRREPTRDTTPLSKCHPELKRYKKYKKQKKIGKVLQRNLLMAAEREIIRNSSSVTPGITPTESRKTYSEHDFMPVNDNSVHHGLTKSNDLNQISQGLLPKHFSKSNSRRRSFCVYTKLLFLHNKRRINPKSVKKYEAIKGENKIIASPAIRKKHKRKLYNFERDRPIKTHGSKLRVNFSSNCTIPVASASITLNFCNQGQQSLTRCLSLSKPTSTPYAKTVTVYSVYDQRPKRMPAAKLGSKSSFNVKFYKSMGDGRQMFGDGSPYMQIPRNYSPTNMARAGRDEDGRICVCIPQENDYGGMVPRYDTGESSLMRYIRVLLKDNKRSLRRPPPIPSPHGYWSPNPCPGRMMMPADYNVGCKCKQNNAKKNFRCNDAAIQCKCKETRERGSDDIYRRERGTICSGPMFPEHGNKSIPRYSAPITDQQPGKRDKNAVNIGSNFSFQMGLYKRFIDTNPNQDTFSTNQSTFNEPKRDDNYFVNLPANDPSLRYMDGDARYNTARGRDLRYMDGDARYNTALGRDLRYMDGDARYNTARGRDLRYMDGDARYNTARGRDDCGCSASDVSAYHEPKPSVLIHMLTPRNLKCCSTYSSNQTISQGSPPPTCGMPKCPSRSSLFKQCFFKQFERSDLCCNNEPKSHCKPKHKAVDCRCDKKPMVIGCTDSKKNVRIGSTLSKAVDCRCDKKSKVIGCTDSKKNVGIGSILSASTASTLASCKCYPVKNIGCLCSNEPILAACLKKSSCKCTKSGKCKKSGKCTKLKKKGRNCNCGPCGKCKKTRSLFNIFCKKKERCCCCNERKFSLGRILNTLLQKKPLCNKCNLRKICKCPPKSPALDYKKVLNNLKISSRRQKKAEEQPCPCGSINVKEILSSLLTPVEPKHQTRAQQCKCKGKFDMKRTFGRLLLFNTVQKPICCSSVSYDQNARSVGIGEEDYRKIPPRCRLPDKSQGDGFQMNKFVSKLINPETSTRMHYSAFNPLNQCEAGMQHNTRMGPDDRAGATVCRNQGSCVPRSKPMTLRDCENATCPALHNVDPNRKAVRLGSNCSFSLEFYKGMPPAKACPPPCPASCKPPCPAPCADTRPSSPCKQAQPFIQRAAKYMVTNPKPKRQFKPTCKKCDTCVKVPIVKRGFAQMILKDKKPLHGARTCQKTNTLQPTHKLVTRKPTAGKGLGAVKNCDPYVCLKRINQRKCCK